MPSDSSFFYYCERSSRRPLAAAAAAAVHRTHARTHAHAKHNTRAHTPHTPDGAHTHTPQRTTDVQDKNTFDDVEDDERAEDGGQLKRCLGLMDLILFGIAAIIGAGIFVVTGLEAKMNAGCVVVVGGVLCVCVCVCVRARVAAGVFTARERAPDQECAQRAHHPPLKRHTPKHTPTP